MISGEVEDEGDRLGVGGCAGSAYLRCNVVRAHCSVRLQTRARTIIRQPPTSISAPDPVISTSTSAGSPA